MREPIENQRRKPGARGSLVKLSDGQPWLLAEPLFRPSPAGLTSPDVDLAIDRFYEQIILGERVELADVFEVARKLLLANYELSDDELNSLLGVEGALEVEAEPLARAVLEALFGPDQRVRGYVDWVRASLLANGLAATEIPSSAINDVLTILMATNRTVPPAQFVDACRAALNRESLEDLV